MNRDPSKTRVVLIFAVAVFIALLTILGRDIVKTGRLQSPAGSAGAPRHVAVQLKWFDQAQFGGFYAAKYFGYFKNHDLDVDIIPGSPQISALQQLETGRADIAIVDADQALAEFARGNKLKVVGAVFNRSAVCFMVKDGSPVREPTDFRKRTVAVYRGMDTEHVLMSLLRKAQLRPSELNIVSAGPLEAFRNGDVEVFPAYTFNEPLTMADEGVPTRCVLPDDFGVYYYSDVIVTTLDYYTNHKDVLMDFLKASAQGWSDAEADPAHIVATMIANIRSFPEKDEKARKHQVSMLATLLPLLRGGNENVMFYMDRARWISMERSLVDIGAIPAAGQIDGLVDFQIGKALQ